MAWGGKEGEGCGWRGAEEGKGRGSSSSGRAETRARAPSYERAGWPRDDATAGPPPPSARHGRSHGDLIRLPFPFAFGFPSTPTSDRSHQPLPLEPATPKPSATSRGRRPSSRAHARASTPAAPLPPLGTNDPFPFPPISLPPAGLATTGSQLVLLVQSPPSRQAPRARALPLGPGPSARKGGARNPPLFPPSAPRAEPSRAGPHRHRWPPGPSAARLTLEAHPTLLLLLLLLLLLPGPSTRSLADGPLDAHPAFRAS